MSTELASSAAAEWSALVTTAVLGADRHPLPAATGGWERWPHSADPAAALLDRAAAVVVARRAGATPAPPPPGRLPEAPPDRRPPCTAACAERLRRILAGEHDIVLGEWLARIEQVGMQLPWALLPALLLRGRRRPELDQVVRRLAGGRAAWLAQAVPELGVKSTPAGRATPVPPLQPVPAPPDSHAVVHVIIAQIETGGASWASAPQLQLLVAGLVPDALVTFVREVNRLDYIAATARTRSELTSLAEFRLAMLYEFETAEPSAAPDPTGDPS